MLDPHEPRPRQGPVPATGANVSKFSKEGLQRYADSIVEGGGAPGVSVAVWRQNELYSAASGVISIETGVRVSTNTLFQIGSISKVFTASLVMLLVDERKLELDVPVRAYLPDFHVGDREAVQKITVRHLLSHTSGLESDIYAEDYSEQGNAIARYVDRCFLLPQVHKEFGRKFSYSNAAYTVAGRLVEVLTGMPWAQAVDELIYKPLGMKLSLSSPMQTLRFSATMGHMYKYRDGSGAGEWSTAPYCYLPLGMAPAGAILSTSASDLIRFARAHLADGRSESGKQWMSERSAKAMRDLQVTLPGRTSLFETGWGLGWSLTELDGIKMFGHSGGAIGHQALLHVMPECNVIFCFQSNGMRFGGSSLIPEVLADVIHDVTGFSVRRSATVAKACDLDRFCGVYGATGKRFIVENKGQHLEVETFNDGLALGRVRVKLMPTIDGGFLAYSPSGEDLGEVAFVDSDDHGYPKYFFYGHRLNVRVKPC